MALGEGGWGPPLLSPLPPSQTQEISTALSLCYPNPDSNSSFFHPGKGLEYTKASVSMVSSARYFLFKITCTAKKK